MKAPDRPPAPTHQIRMELRGGHFTLPTCSCGWVGTARMSVKSAREEARDHVLLYAGQPITGQPINDSDAVDPAGPAPAG